MPKKRNNFWLAKICTLYNTLQWTCLSVMLLKILNNECRNETLLIGLCDKHSQIHDKKKKTPQEKEHVLIKWTLNWVIKFIFDDDEAHKMYKDFIFTFIIITVKLHFYDVSQIYWKSLLKCPFIIMFIMNWHKKVNLQSEKDILRRCRTMSKCRKSYDFLCIKVKENKWL